MAKKRKNRTDRNKDSVKLIRDKLRNEMEDKIRSNNRVMKKAEEELPKLERQLDLTKRFYDVNRKMLTAKLSGSKIVRPVFEYETTDTWQELFKELLSIELERFSDQEKGDLERM